RIFIFCKTFIGRLRLKFSIQSKFCEVEMLIDDDAESSEWGYIYAESDPSVRLRVPSDQLKKNYIKINPTVLDDQLSHQQLLPRPIGGGGVKNQFPTKSNGQPNLNKNPFHTQSNGQPNFKTRNSLLLSDQKNSVKKNQDDCLLFSLGQLDLQEDHPDILRNSNNHHCSHDSHHSISNPCHSSPVSSNPSPSLPSSPISVPSAPPIIRIKSVDLKPPQALHPYRVRAPLQPLLIKSEAQLLALPPPPRPKISPLRPRSNTNTRLDFGNPSLSTCSASTSTSSSLSLQPQSSHTDLIKFYSQPPKPPPTCPLPSIPAKLSPTPPPSAQSSKPFSGCKDAEPRASLLRTKSSGSLQSILSIFPQSSLKPSINSHQIHSSTIYHHLNQTRENEDPFAAEKIVIPPNFKSNNGICLEDSVNPISPMRSHSRTNSLYALSESCYSVNTIVESVPHINEHENLNGRPLNKSILKDLALSKKDSKEILASSSPKSFQTPVQAIDSQLLPWETFRFRLPNRLDGFFFLNHRRPSIKDICSPPISIEISPPISSNYLIPGDWIRVKIFLSELFENVVISFVGESRLIGEQKLKSHTFLSHSIDLKTSGNWGHWEVEEFLNGSGWLVNLKIPELANCDCAERFGQEELKIPASKVNEEVFISYHIVVRGIGKQKKRESPMKRNKAKGEEKIRLSVMLKSKNSKSGLGNLVSVGKHGEECVCVSS
ncbi:hypothetical protein O181_031187, partial [Austropuccinia psidii MF-1]|nr:hypothetical protein [Austropuccinia psidii MF-1]